MLNDKDRAEMDQGIAACAEMFPRMWHSLYEGLKAEGFTEEQSFRLLIAYILSQNIKGLTA
jgi:endonuclease III